MVLKSNSSGSDVPRARHCWIPVSFPSVSLKNAPSVGLWARHRKSPDFFFAVYNHFVISQPSYTTTMVEKANFLPQKIFNIEIENLQAN